MPQRHSVALFSLNRGSPHDRKNRRQDEVRIRSVMPNQLVISHDYPEKASSSVGKEEKRSESWTMSDRLPNAASRAPGSLLQPYWLPMLMPLCLTLVHLPTQ